MRRLISLSVVAALAIVGLVVPVTPASAFDLSTCTITGTAGDDTLTGTAGDDIICADGGTDTVIAGDGNDTVYVTAGTTAIVDLGIGNDTFLGADALVSTVNGGPGADVITGGTGNDTLNGDDDADIIFGGAGADVITGGLGDDVLAGQAGVDNIDGNAGTNYCDTAIDETFNLNCTADTTAPSTANVALSSSTVDVSAADATTTVSLDLTDTVGLKSVSIVCAATSGWNPGTKAIDYSATFDARGAVVTSSHATTVTPTGTTTALSFTATIATGFFPNNYPCDITRVDQFNNTATTTAAITLTITRSGVAYDNAGPVLSNLVWTSSTVDSGPAAANTTLSFDLTDDTGIKDIVVVCAATGGWNPGAKAVDYTATLDYLGAVTTASTTTRTTVVGTKTSVSIDLTIPHGYFPNTYPCTITTHDFLTNATTSTATTTLTVTRSGAGYDSTGPTVANGALTPTSVDSGPSAPTTDFSIDLTDITGNHDVSFVCAATTGFNVGHKAVDISATFDHLGAVVTSSQTISSTLVGTTLTVSGTATISMGTFPNTYPCTVVAHDFLGNATTASAGKTLTVTRTGSYDSAGPTKTSFALTPNSVDAGPASASVSMDLVLSDVSGVSDVTVVCASTSGGLAGSKAIDYSASFAGNGTLIAASSPTSTSKSGNDLTIAATITVAHGQFPNDYSCSYTAHDFLTNTGTAAGIGTLTVTRTGAGYDTAGPTKTSFTVSPTTVDLGTATASVTVSITLADASGVKDVAVVCAPTGGWNPGEKVIDYTATLDGFGALVTSSNATTVTGTTTAPTLVSTFVLPIGQFPNDYVCGYTAHDFLNNAGSASSIGTLTVTRTGGSYDSTGPTVANVTLSPVSVDSGPSAPTTAFGFDITDVTGIRDMSFVCSAVAGSFNAGTKAIDISATFTNLGVVITSSQAITASLTGTTLSLSGTATVPIGTFPNTYPCTITTHDFLGNTTTQTNATSLTVTRSGAGYDTAGPAKSTFTFTPTSVDVGPAAASTSLSFALTDASGVADVTVVCASTTGGKPGTKAVDYSATLAGDGSIIAASSTSSSSRTGTTTTIGMTLTIAHGLFPNTYSCNYTAHDFLGNASSGSAIGSLTVVRTGPGYDTAGPTQSSFSFTPASVEVGTSAQTVTLAVTLSDPSDTKDVAIACAPTGGWNPGTKVIDYTATFDGLGAVVTASNATTTSLTGTDLTLFSTFTIPLGQFPNTYLCSYTAHDFLNNAATSASIGSLIVNRTTGTYDAVGPTEDAFSLTPTTVDVGAASVSTNMRVVLTDVTGISDLAVTCTATTGFNPGTKAIDYAATFNNLGSVTYASSTTTTTRSGNTLTITSPVAIAYGLFPNDYSCALTTHDFLSNETIATGIGTLTVRRTGATWDSTGPAVSNYSVTPTSFNVGETSQDVTLSATLTDVSGIKNLSFVCVSAANNKVIDYTASFDNLGAVVTSSNATTSSLTGTALTISSTFTVAYWYTPGTYNCTYTTNDFLNNATTGTNATTLTITRIPPFQPDPPTGLTFDRTRPSAGTLSWTAPGYVGVPALYDYEIQYSLDGTNWTTITDGVNTNTSYAISGMRISTQYWYRVRGENGGGYGKWSDPISFTNPGATTPDAPTGVTIDQITPTTIRANWTAPAYDGDDAIIDYKVEYSSDGGNNWTTYTHTASASTRMTITGLRGLTTYLVRVSAINLIGTGAASATGSGTTTATRPSEPRNVFVYSTGPTTVTLAWDLPTELGGIDITDYTVEYSSDNGLNWTVYPHTASAARVYLVDGLAKGTAYKFRVKAVNVVGSSLLYSNVVSGTTLTTPPGAPSGVVLSNLTATSTQVDWVAPTDRGGLTITDYVIQYSADNGTTWITWTDAVSTTTRVTITGLLGGTDYMVRVYAVNALGTSTNPSASGLGRTLNGPASAPLNLRTTAITSYTLALAWDLPYDRGGTAITDYTIEYSADNGLTWTALAHTASNARTATIGALTKGGYYKVRVAAINSNGRGTWAAIDTGTTPTVPNMPTALEVISIGNTSIGVRWVVPSDPGGRAITDYIVETSKDGGNTWVANPHAAFTLNSYTATGLTGATNYMVRVAAVNSVGRGVNAFAVTATTTSAPPGPVRNLKVAAIDLDSAKLTWDVPLDNGGIPIIDYIVEYSSDNGATWDEFPHLAFTRTYVLVDTLLANKTYKFNVRAINSLNGPSLTDVYVTGRTVLTPPGQVTGVRLSSLATKTSVKLAWTKPTSIGSSQISNYIVELSTNNGKTWKAVSRAASTATSLSLTKLKSKTVYSVRIKAASDAGSGKASTTFKFSTK